MAALLLFFIVCAGEGAVAVWLFCAAGLAASWRGVGRPLYLGLVCVDLLGPFPVLAAMSARFGGILPWHQWALYGAGVLGLLLLLFCQRLPEVLPLRGKWARRLLATGSILALLGSVLPDPAVALRTDWVVGLLVLLGIYLWPLWWAMVHGWEKPAGRPEGAGSPPV